MRSSHIIDIPPAGTACASCRTKKHFCPARTYRGDDPACEACAEGRDCDTVITLRRLKEPWLKCAEEPEETSIASVRTVDPASVTVLPAIEISIPVRHPGNCGGARSEAAALHNAVEVRRRKNEYANKKGRRDASAPNADPIKEKPAMPETIEAKKCRVPDCTCSASSKGSFCTQRHYYLLKKEMAGKPIVMPVPRVPQNEQAASQPAAQSVGDLDNVHLRSDFVKPLQITFTLTEQQCDALYRRCTPEQKVAAMSSLLHSLLAI